MVLKYIDIGINFTEFKPSGMVAPITKLCYYDKGQLTDDFYIVNVGIWDGEKYCQHGDTAKAFVFGDVKEGDYLGTSSHVKGTLQKTVVKEGACAIAISDRVSLVNKPYTTIGVVDVKIL